MFAFGISRTLSQMTVFAAEPSTMGWILIVAAVVVVSRLFRPSRRVNAQGVRKRRGFPWKIAAVVVLGIVAVKSMREPRWDWINVEHFAGHARFHDDAFPKIHAEDLWALRDSAEDDDDDADRPRNHGGATPTSISKTITSAVERATDGRIAPTAQAPAAPSTRVAETKESRADEPDATSYNLPVQIAPHVARTVAEASELAHRAMVLAQSLYDQTHRDAVALKALTKAKSATRDVEIIAHANKPAPQNDASAAPSLPPAPAPPPLPALPNVSLPAPEVKVAVVAPAPPQAPANAVTAPVANSPVSAALPPSMPPSPAPPTVVQSKQAPAWLTSTPGLERDTYFTTVVVGPYKTIRECEERLPAELQDATSAYIDSYLGAGASKVVHIRPAYIQDHLVKDRYVEEIQSDTPTVGTMSNLHVRLGFDRRFKTQLQRMHRDADIENRLLTVAGGAGMVLVVLGTLFGYLKLDTMTRGYYTRRLQFAAAAVILTTVAAAGAAFVDSPQKLPSLLSPPTSESTVIVQTRDMP